jgi:phage terminase large subunit-like protein
MDDEELRDLLAEVYAGAAWVDLDRLVREVRDPGAPWSETQRFFFNLPTGGTFAAVDPMLWASRARQRRLETRERIALGFDGSHSRDGTALVACTADGWLWPIEIIERPAGADDWRVDRSLIRRALERTFESYDVSFVYADPWRWQDELDEWAERWPDRVVSWPTNSTKRMAPAVDRFRTAIEEERVTHNGDATLTRHVVNARLRKVGRSDDGRGLYTLEKAGPGRLIDACVAALLAYEASTQIPPKKQKPAFAFV